MKYNTPNGALHVANYVNDPRYGMSEPADVYLPVGAMDPDERFYYYWLLEHPHPRVRLHYTEAEICKH